MRYFGADIDEQLRKWHDGEFKQEFREKYGTEAAAATQIVRPEWRHLVRFGEPVPMDWMYNLYIPGSRPEGELQQNVYFKMQFTLATGMNSAEARYHTDLLQPGMFPYAGAGIHRGYLGGTSGLLEESDWWVFCRIVDKLADLRAVAAAPAIAASKARVRDWKHLLGDPANLRPAS